MTSCWFWVDRTVCSGSISCNMSFYAAAEPSTNASTWNREVSSLPTETGASSALPFCRCRLGSSMYDRNTPNGWMLEGFPHWRRKPNGKPSRRSARACMSWMRAVRRRMLTIRAVLPSPCSDRPDECRQPDHAPRPDRAARGELPPAGAPLRRPEPTIAPLRCHQGRGKHPRSG